MDPEAGFVDGVRHGFADIGEVRLHYVEAGVGPLVVLLHGFPDFWYSWRHQIPALAAAGYRVVAPDLRGFNRSSKPRSVDAYRYDVIGDDVAGLVRHLGATGASLAGHDWGGAIAWMLAMRCPELIDRLAILNCPHPTTLVKALTDPRQLTRSWYMGFFQIPRVPELFLARNDFAALRRLYPTGRGAFTDTDVRRYLEAARRSERLRGGINLYRAAARRAPLRLRDELRRVDGRVLVVWGDRDAVLRKELAEVPARWAPNARIEHVPDAGHWVHHEAPTRVNDLLRAFLAGT